jgi:hypothetical protein
LLVSHMALANTRAVSTLHAVPLLTGVEFGNAFYATLAAQHR